MEAIMNTLNNELNSLNTLRYDIAIAVLAIGMGFGLVAKLFV
jgi:hypothetical protein